VGHQIEREVRSAKRYDISVRMEDGSVKVLSTETQPTWRSGDKVRIREGHVQAI
jgi:outer membrane lipoprotein SlyB